MKKLIIITGVNKGLGEAFFNFFLKDESITIIAISRNFSENQKLIKGKNKQVIFLQKDLSTLKDVEAELNLSLYYSPKFEEVIFINNAATINPIEAIGNFKDHAIINSIQLNTIAPLLLTNNIIKHNTSNKVRIFNITSGASKRPIVGWSLYCSTKSANEMFFNTLKLQEENNKNIEIYNLDPGVMDTDMQKNIRSKEEKQMPNVNVFKDYHKTEKLKSAIEVAQEIVKTHNII
ncbi:SDR family NAD(P)-dependent oxidoreductase [Algibacter sp. PT7-4]|uniref:SDR family NAD(P)-dependent oxidoreductase n=1 Tax=Algibacter ulvanivorans TaxID=3400999 RepID=UPI003AB06299